MSTEAERTIIDSLLTIGKELVGERDEMLNAVKGVVVAQLDILSRLDAIEKRQAIGSVSRDEIKEQLVKLNKRLDSIEQQQSARDGLAEWFSNLSK